MSHVTHESLIVIGIAAGAILLALFFFGAVWKEYGKCEHAHKHVAFIFFGCVVAGCLIYAANQLGLMNGRAIGSFPIALTSSPATGHGVTHKTPIAVKHRTKWRDG